MTFGEKNKIEDQEENKDLEYEFWRDWCNEQNILLAEANL